MNYYTVALDGPSGAGKSTIAKEVAKQLNLTYIDTGAMYRAIAYGCLSDNIDINDKVEISNWLKDKTIDFNKDNNVCINKEDVSAFIRNEKVSQASSIVASYKDVRQFAVNAQREMANNQNVILDGRDIGSVVFPNATVKLYLSADVETRAKRRYEQNIQAGIKCDYQQVLEDVKQRDYRDTHRDISPLVKVSDAIEIDSSNITLQETIDTVINIIKEKIK